MTKKNDIEKYESVQYWFKGLSKTSIKNYRSEFPDFLDWLKKQGLDLNPDELIELRKQDLKEEDKRRQRRFEKLVEEYYRELYDDPDVAEYSAYSKLRTARSFFGRNHYALEYRKGDLPTPTPKEVEYVPTNDDVRTMWEVANSKRDQALLLSLYQTGLSEQDVGSWDLEKFLPVLKSKDHYFEYYRGKTKILVQGCLGEDAVVALKQYLTIRENPTEGPVFVSRGGGRGGGKAGDPIDTRRINEIIQGLAKLADLPENFKTKYLRDAFRAKCEEAEIPSDTTERMMGWKLGGAKSHYRLPKPVIVKAYRKAYPLLTINGSVRPSEKYASQIAEFNAHLLKIISTSSDPKLRKSAGILLSDIDKISLSVINDKAFPSFKALVKRALENSRA